jgi:hypothetical protein
VEINVVADNFKSHGKCDINIKDNIIVIDAQGPWNLEFVQQLHKNLIAAVKQIDNSQYFVLLVPYGEALVVSEGIDYHINFIKKSNVSAVALNLNHTSTKSITKSLFEKIYQTAGIKHKFFTCNNLAEQWLLSHLKN